jgi:type I restriction enzyme S subunit
VTETKRVKLGEVAEFIRGITFKPTDVVDRGTPGAVVCMRTSNVQKALEVDDVLTLPQEFVNREEQYLREGDMLVSSANSWNLVGKACWVPRLDYRATAGGFISILRALPGKVDARYLYRWFTEPKTQTMVRNCGRQTTNISNLSMPRCLAIELPLPPLAEQKRIAALLDKADALRAKRRHALATLDTLLQSIFLDMFGDPVSNPEGLKIVRLGDLIIDGPQNGLYRPSTDYGSGTRIVRIDCFYDGLIDDMTQLKRVRLDPHDTATFALHENDILVNRVNSREYLGKSAIVPALAEPTVFESNIMRVTLDSTRIDPTFAIFQMQGSRIKRQIQRLAKDAVNQSSINQNDVRSFEMMMPSVEEQRHFARKVNGVRDLRGLSSRSLASVETLFASLQSAAFTGKLFDRPIPAKANLVAAH